MIAYGVFLNYKIHQTQDLECPPSSTARECATALAAQFSAAVLCEYQSVFWLLTQSTFGGMVD